MTHHFLNRVGAKNIQGKGLKVRSWKKGRINIDLHFHFTSCNFDLGNTLLLQGITLMLLVKALKLYHIFHYEQILKHVHIAPKYVQFGHILFQTNPKLGRIGIHIAPKFGFSKSFSIPKTQL